MILWIGHVTLIQHNLCRTWKYLKPAGAKLCHHIGLILIPVAQYVTMCLVFYFFFRCVFCLFLDNRGSKEESIPLKKSMSARPPVNEETPGEDS